jgi:hypothetical protein
MWRFASVGLAAAALVAGSAQAEPQVNDMARMMASLGGGGKTGGKLEKAIAKAAAHPLGSRANPVRAKMPDGQRAYLTRLRCANGQAPEFHRAGNIGPGIYGYIVDDYRVSCAGAEAVSVIIDMYHVHVEQQPVPGFTIVAEGTPPSLPPPVPVTPPTAPAEPVTPTS